MNQSEALVLTLTIEVPIAVALSAWRGWAPGRLGIVAVASLAGRVGVPTRTGYSASKHAMAGFFDSLRIELADSGVSVTMIYPGFVATGIRENATGPDGKAIMTER